MDGFPRIVFFFFPGDPPHVCWLRPRSDLLPRQDILLITGSVLIFGSPVTRLQVFGACRLFGLALRICSRVTGRGRAGYSIALGGLVLFKTSGGK